MTGASGGIGREIVGGLLREGAQVFAGYHRHRSVLEPLLETYGADALIPVAVDVGDPDDIDRVVRELLERSGRLDILVHAAGVARDGLLLRARASQVDEGLGLNLGSAIHCARAVLAPMLKARYGRIVFLGSVVAAMGNAGQGVYAAAKAGVEGLARSLAREVGRRGVTVNTVSPGFIETEMTAGMSEDARRSVIEATAVGRLGQPADVAHSVLFFCDESASYVTGATMQVGGGLYM